MHFRGHLELHGKTATGIEVPPDVVTALGSGRRPAVRVTLGLHTYRTTVAPMGGGYFIPVRNEVRTAAGLTAGDSVDVTIEVDTAPRTVAVPDELAAALDAEPELRTRWDEMSYTNRRELAESITGAKKPQTRERRVIKAVEVLRGR